MSAPAANPIVLRKGVVKQVSFLSFNMVFIQSIRNPLFDLCMWLNWCDFKRIVHLQRWALIADAEELEEGRGGLVFCDFNFPNSFGFPLVDFFNFQIVFECHI